MNSRLVLLALVLTLSAGCGSGSSVDTGAVGESGGTEAFSDLQSEPSTAASSETTTTSEPGDQASDRNGVTPPDGDEAPEALAAVEIDEVVDAALSVCEGTERYGVRAATGVEGLWYHVDAQWIELSDRLMFTSYVTVRNEDHIEIRFEDIPPELLTDKSIAAANICFYEINDLESSDYDDPGVYRPYDVVPRGGVARPSRPGA